MSDGLAQAMANSAAESTGIRVQDCFVLIGWLAERVEYLENFVATYEHFGVPEMPSAMRGFACLPRRDEAVRAALAKCR